MVKLNCKICNRVIYRWPYKVRDSGNFCSVSCVRKYYGNNQYKHGLAGTRFQKIYSRMHVRCYRKSWHAYERYGGRGITVCNRWHKFENFIEDMKKSYDAHVNKFGETETTLDRVDINKGYNKTNCRWATWKEQFANRRY